MKEREKERIEKKREKKKIIVIKHLGGFATAEEERQSWRIEDVAEEEKPWDAPCTTIDFF